MKQEELFRKKSLDRVKSPENLDDYIRVSNPGVWLLLISVILLLAGACVWGIFGHVDSTLKTRIYAENGTTVCAMPEKSSAVIKVGMTVKADGFTADISAIKRDENGHYFCVLQTEQPIPDGVYDGSIVTDSIKPLSFILN